MTEFNVGFEEHGIRVTHHMPDQDGVYAKEVFIPSGKELRNHSHTFTHKSILASGRAVVRAGRVEQFLVGPVLINLKEGVEHSIRAVTDVTWFCLHASDETDPEKIDHTLVQEN
jgi:quercetin dioxygenase-like cupin family protein